MRWTLSLALLSSLLLGASIEFKGKVEPFQQWTIKSDVAGKVVKVRLDMEGRVGDDRPIVELDTGDDLIKLRNSLTQLKLLKEEIKLQKEVVQKKLDLYNRIKDLKTKSLLEKDQRFFDYSGSYMTRLNLKQNLAQTEAEVELLRRTIEKKRFKAPGLYIVKIYPRPGDFIGVGAPVLDVADLNREKIVIFVPVSQIGEVKGAKVLINGHPSQFKLFKIWRVTDRQYITSYRVELVGKGLPVGKIVSIRFEKGKRGSFNSSNN
jgi:multidrug efflux pump subunit AcrA (membrane-fusion protein)